MKNTSIQLVIPTIAMKEQALAFRKEHFDVHEHTIYGSELFDQIVTYEEWLQMVTDNTQEESVHSEWVVTDTFFAVEKTSNDIVGIIDLRHILNDFLKDFGHCGYSVRPTKRRKGYATQMLSQLCCIAKQQGMTHLQLSVETSNIASIKTIKYNGGMYTRSFTFEDKQAHIYSITL